MEIVIDILLKLGIPSAITGFGIWWVKRKLDKAEAASVEHEKNLEKLMKMMIGTIKANNVLAVATAKAVQRIPDAQCNGDMTSALEEAARIQKEEKEFLVEQGIKNIFE